jgi:hypothetical protein
MFCFNDIFQNIVVQLSFGISLFIGGQNTINYLVFIISHPINNFIGNFMIDVKTSWLVA